MKRTGIEMDNDEEHQQNRNNYQQTFLLNLEANSDGLVQNLKESLMLVDSIRDATIYILNDRQYLNQYWLYLKTQPERRLLSRNYFSGTSKGKQILDKNEIKVLQNVKSKLISNELNRLCSMQSVNGFDQITADYIVQQNISLCFQDQALQLQYSKSTNRLDKLEFEYIRQLEVGLQTPVQFIESHRGNVQDYKSLVFDKKQLQSLYDQAESTKKRSKVFGKPEPMATTLIEFCKANPLPASCEWDKTSNIILDGPYYKVADAFVKYFIMRVDKKKGTLILNGPPNTDKSIIHDYIKQIFCCISERLHRGNTLDHQSTEGIQLVLFNELNKELFTPDNLSSTKELLEGRGMTTRCLYKNHRISYEGACVLMTTNSLPYILLDDLHPEYEAFKIRVEVIDLDQQHQSTEQFPFSVVEFAHFLEYLYKLCQKDADDNGQDNEEVDKEMEVQEEMRESKVGGSNINTMHIEHSKIPMEVDQLQSQNF